MGRVSNTYAGMFGHLPPRPTDVAVPSPKFVQEGSQPLKREAPRDTSKAAPWKRIPPLPTDDVVMTSPPFGIAETPQKKLADMDISLTDSWRMRSVQLGDRAVKATCSPYIKDGSESGDTLDLGVCETRADFSLQWRDYETAANYYGAIADAYQDMDDHPHEIAALRGKCHAFEAKGQAEGRIYGKDLSETYQRLLVLYREEGNYQKFAEVLGRLIRLDQWDTSEVMDACAWGIEICQEFKNPKGALQFALLRASIFLSPKFKKYHEAHTLFQAVLQTDEAQMNQNLRTEALVGMTSALFGLYKDQKDTYLPIAEAVKLFVEGTVSEEMMGIIVGQLVRIDKYLSAKEALKAAIMEKITNNQWIFFSRLAAVHLEKKGDLLKGDHNYATVSSHYSLSRKFLKVVGDTEGLNRIHAKITELRIRSRQVTAGSG